MAVVDLGVRVGKQALIAVKLAGLWRRSVRIGHSMRAEYAFQVAVVYDDAKVAGTRLGGEEETVLARYFDFEVERDAAHFGVVPFVEASRAVC